MKSEDFVRLVSQRSFKTTRDELEKMICSEPFLAVYQAIVLEIEEQQLGLINADLSYEPARYATTKRQGQLIGMRMTLERFIEMTKEEETANAPSE